MRPLYRSVLGNLQGRDVFASIESMLQLRGGSSEIEVVGISLSNYILAASEPFFELSALLLNAAGGLLLTVGSLFAILNTLLLVSNNTLGTKFCLIAGGT
jgi:hypothetical protein